MTTHAGTDPHRAPVPDGWPGDDPTLPEELDVLGARPHRPTPPDRTGESAGDRAGDGPGAGAGARAVGDGVHDDDVRPAARAARAVPPDRGTTLDDDPIADDGEEIDDDHDDHGDDGDDLVAGVQPAGRVLVVMVAALVLALLVNIDALVERAERRPPGDERDRALAILHPIQDVSHVLQLHRVRQAADRLAGDDGDDPGTTPAPPSRRAPGADDGAPAPDEAAGRDVEGAFALRTPTADEPLRLWVGGDFMAQALGEALATVSEATGVVDAELRYESATGLTRQDYFDWPATLEDVVDDHEPEVVVVVFGANDAQGIVLGDGTPAQVDDPRWAGEYGRRVGAVMDQLEADDRLVIWVGPPPMREPTYSGRMAGLNRIYAEQAAARPWVTVVDPAAVVGDGAGAYADAVADPTTGAAVAVRQPDGIHLTPEGADLLAAHVLSLVQARVDLSGAADDGG